MEPSETEVKYKIRIFKDTHADVELLKEQFSVFFCECLGNGIVPEVICDWIKTVKEYNLLDEIQEICYTVSYAHKNMRKRVDFLIGETCRKWCDYKTTQELSCWMMPSRNERFNHAVRATDKNVKIAVYAFGTFPSMCTFSQHYQFKETKKSEIIASFFHPQKFFAVHFYMIHNENCTEPKKLNAFKLEVKYNTISRIVVYNSPQASNIELFFHLIHPAFAFAITDGKSLHENETILARSMTERMLSSKWERTLQFFCKCNHTFCHVQRIGKTPVMKLVVPDKYQASRIVDQLAQKCGKTIEICYGMVNTVTAQKIDYFHYFPRPVRSYGRTKQSYNVSDENLFKCQYAWQAIFSLSLVIMDQVALKQEKLGDKVNYSQLLQSKLRSYIEIDPVALSSALTHIFYMISKNCIFDFEKSLDTLFSHCKLNKEEPELPPGMCVVHRVIITPSRMILLPPKEHFDNRVIRKFGPEHMLRLSFQDDNYSKLTYAVQFNTNKEQFMVEVVGKVLLNGIRIADRKYEILASSNSQLREHGMWMYAADGNGQTAANIRQWMGDFSHLPNVAKYMARMGQCFSTSDSAVQISLDNSDEINLTEVKTWDRKYVFSDGIGMISEQLRQEVLECLKKNTNQETSKEFAYEPSAFQIRYKGIKGMVALNPKLQGRRIGIRPSMNKFNCENSSLLEIVKISAPRNLFLNKPLISIMEQLGVPASSFLNLQMDMILDLISSLLDDGKATLTLYDHINLNIPFVKLQKTGFSFTSDPFFRSLLLGLYKQSIEMLKEKIRIAVPPKFGRNMLGVLDETESLKYGEVFVQYSESLNENIVSSLKILKGDVLVTKNPCMHPGDVRKFHAVDIEALHHIKDCIVFPAEGRRPHPDEMAGSDLDGDEYVVIWKPDLIFSRKNVKPMDYATQNERKTEGKIGVNEMVSFFCEYIMNDQIGIFANAHLAWADLHQLGIFSDKCMKIAQIYPLVLDFAKTGYSAEPGSIQRPPRYPDFMEKAAVSDSYRSEKVLGSLYRINRHLQACVNNIDLNDKFLLSSCDPDFEYPEWGKYESWAKELKAEFVEIVEAVLNKCGAQSFAAALTGHIKENLYDRNRYDVGEMKRIIITYFRHIMVKFKVKFINAIESESMNSSQTQQEKKACRYQRASALYMVVYQKGESNAIALPWAVSDILVEMKQEKLKSKCIKLLQSKCSLINDCDAIIRKMFPIANTTHEAGSICGCVSDCEIILRKWMTFSGLNLSKSEFCKVCFNRIFCCFREKCKKCCSHSKSNSCICTGSCSTMTLILRFLRFCITDTSDPLGTCSMPECNGFNEGNLKIVALQTFANLAITNNLMHVGLKTDDIETVTDDDIAEGNLVRLPVTDDKLRELVSKHKNKIISFLQQKTGVKTVSIDTEEDKRGKWHLLISSVGRSWQRCNLEELVLSQNLVEILTKAVC